MKWKNIVPILYSTDVLRSLQYYTEVLGFDRKWDWGDPPDFGGVSKDHIEIFFCEKGQGNPGTWLSIFVEDVDELYTAIKAKGARIISPPTTMEWGVREMLVEDPDGHRIRFGHPASHRQQSAPELPPNIRIVDRRPTPAEYRKLITAVGWSTTSDAGMIDSILGTPVFSVVAEDTASGNTVGCALLLGDRASFFYVKDVMVDPAWQGKRVGTAMMKALIGWTETHAPNNSLVGLYTGQNLTPFYQQFGFHPAFGMTLRISQNKDA